VQDRSGFAREELDTALAQRTEIQTIVHITSNTKTALSAAALMAEELASLLPERKEPSFFMNGEN
jgi:hypothetical protein